MFNSSSSRILITTIVVLITSTLLTHVCFDASKLVHLLCFGLAVFVGYAVGVFITIKIYKQQLDKAFKNISNE